MAPKKVNYSRSISSDHNSMELENQPQEETRKNDHMETNQHATTKPVGQWEIKKKEI